VEYSGTIGEIPVEGIDRRLEGNCFICSLFPLLRPSNYIGELDESTDEPYEDLVDRERACQFYELLSLANNEIGTVVCNEKGDPV